MNLIQINGHSVKKDTFQEYVKLIFSIRRIIKNKSLSNDRDLFTKLENKRKDLYERLRKEAGVDRGNLSFSISLSSVIDCLINDKAA